jgi:hypothetical protein
MRKATICGFGLALLFFATGCGDSPEKVMKDQVSLMNDMADVFEKCDSKEGAEKNKSKLEALVKKQKDILDRVEKMKEKKLPKEKEEALKKEYQPKMEQAQKRLVEAQLKVTPEARAVLKDIDLKGLLGR